TIDQRLGSRIFVVFCSTLRCVDCAICTGSVARCPQIFPSNFAGKPLKYISKLLTKRTEFIAHFGSAPTGCRGNNATIPRKVLRSDTPPESGAEKIDFRWTGMMTLGGLLVPCLIEKLKVLLATS